MIVVMATEATSENLEEVKRRIENHEGLTTRILYGVERNVVGVLGTIPPDLKDEMEQVPGVMEVVRISKPYKLASREFHPTNTTMQVGDAVIGGPEPVIMAGPCSVEDEEQMVSTARAVKAAGAKVLRGGAFKPRTSPYSFRGMGIEGLELLKIAHQETGLPIITEVMAQGDVDTVAQYSDILQIGARNMQNYNLLDAVGEHGRQLGQSPVPPLVGLHREEQVGLVARHDVDQRLGLPVAHLDVRDQHAQPRAGRAGVLVGHRSRRDRRPRALGQPAQRVLRLARLPPLMTNYSVFCTGRCRLDWSVGCGARVLLGLENQ